MPQASGNEKQKNLCVGLVAHVDAGKTTLAEALLFTAGFAHSLNGILGLFAPGASLTVALYVYAKEQGEFEVAFAIAAILMILTVLINLSVTLVGKYFQKRRNK